VFEQRDCLSLYSSAQLFSHETREDLSVSVITGNLFASPLCATDAPFCAFGISGDFLIILDVSRRLNRFSDTKVHCAIRRAQLQSVDGRQSGHSSF
jgi:hypothetical protein